VLDRNVGGRFGNKHEGLVEREQDAFVGLDGAFDAVLAVLTGKLLAGADDFASGEATENLSDNVGKGGFVVGGEAVLVLGLKLFLGHIEVKGDLFVNLELHHQEGIAGLALPKGRV